MEKEAPKILVIDDDEVILEVISVYLSQMGCTTICSTSYDDGIIKAEKEQPNLILLDFSIPVISGPEAFKLIKENPATKNIPVVFYTGDASNPKTRDTAFTLGALDVINKDIDAIELKETLSPYLNLSKLTSIMSDSAKIIDDMNAKLQDMNL